MDQGLDRLTTETRATLASVPIPAREWPGPAGDPWLRSWERVDTLLEMALFVLAGHPAADDLIDKDGRRAIAAASSSGEALLIRAAGGLTARLGLEAQGQSE